MPLLRDSNIAIPDRPFVVSRFISIFCLFGFIVPVLASEDLAFFEKHIRPALIEHCYECHSEEGKTKGGLLLDRRDGWAQGGDSGPAIVPGNLEQSLFFEAISYQNPDTEMPPKGKMPDAVIARFKEWIERGAHDPRSEPSANEREEKIDIDSGRKFWSFQPITSPDLPDEGATSGIDRLIQAKLEENQLKPNGPTTPEMRLRRAKTDLTGLLPSIAELDEFVASPTEEKYAELVDRWLADPAFGERWGRHWLDLARYADTSGGGRAMPLPDAWRFRDFVIEAFNEDLPLDDLIRLHIAGDLLPWDDDYQLRERNLIATGFLVLGPHNYENQNKALLELEIADEQIDTIGRAFLGMTIGCARCHDHKFDPIPTADYYALAGIFLSTNSVTHSNVSKWHSEPIPPTREQQIAREKFLDQKDLLENQISDLKKRLARLGRGSGGGMKAIPASILPGTVIDDKDAEKVGDWMESTSNPRFVGNHYIHDQQMERGQKEVIFRHRFESGGHFELRLSYSSGSNRNPKTPVTVGLPGDVLKEYTINQILKPEHDDLFETIDTFRIKSGDEIWVKVSNDTPESGVVIADAIQWLPAEEPSTNPPDHPDALTRNEITSLENELRKAESELKRLKRNLPAIPTAMSVVDHDPEKIGDTEVRIRGVENNLGEKVNRGFLQVASWKRPKIPKQSSGRLELANWIIDPKNPLTSRVLANRIWGHLMGRGIVGSPDNFGTTGQLPTHPELLDFLASRLQEQGFSAKKLIREIVLSDVYSRSSTIKPGSKELATDPENHWYWRGHQKFLDAEVMRDAILTLSDSLDHNAGGPSLPTGFKSEFGYRFTTKKRSVYVPVFRNKGYEMFRLFDFANPNFTVGKRGGSTIPTQALYLTNSPFIHQQAELTASRLLQGTAKSDRHRITRIYREVLGRNPVPRELDLSLSYLRDRGDTPESDESSAWTGLIRALYACIDFRILK